MTVEAPLSVGQLYSWREIESYPADWLKEANLPATWDLRGLSTEQVDAALAALVDRHEPLRTSYELRGGDPVQLVHTDLALPVERVERVITDYAEVDRTTAALVEVPIPMTGGACWRGLLVTSGGAPMFLSLSFSHLILDVWSVMGLERAFRAIVAGTEPTVGASPRELAEQQRDLPHEPAERYWRTVLTDDEVPRLPTLPRETTRERIQLTLHSHRLGALAAEAAQVHGATPPAVLTALVAAGLAEATGASRIAISLMASNRFAAERRHLVGTLNQLIPVHVPVDAATPIAEHIRKVHWASARAYRHAGYHIDRVAALASRLGATDEHDGWFNQLFPCWFNYLQLDDVAPDPADSTPAELVWTPVARRYGQPFDVRVTARDGRLSVAIRTDPEVLAADGLVALLRAIAVGTERAISQPDSPLKDLWGPAELPAELYPAVVPPR